VVTQVEYVRHPTVVFHGLQEAPPP
jgi:hypothetical protein